jgi:riboflavin synthase
MFTGIIEEIGKIKQINKGSKSIKLTIAAKRVLEDTKVGDSIATNGVCLTVTDMTSDAFTVDVMYETMNRTNMKDNTIGSLLNLERALTLNARLGGHLVSGHIDGLGTVQAIVKEDIAKIITIKTDPALLKYIIPKGSVAIDGISLTVIHVTNHDFTVSIIPHTQSQTSLDAKKIGDSVNLECDLIAKHVEKLLNNKTSSTISEDMLKKYGY